MVPDSELLRRYVDEGSQDAFRELVQRHINFVYTSALRRSASSTHVAAEITQEVFCALAGNASRLRDYSTLVGWLFVATRFVASKALRREQRRRCREQEAYIMQNLDSGGAPDVALGQQIRPMIDTLLDGLSNLERAAVLLRFFENQSFAEIGAKLRISEDAARMRVDRVLKKMSDRLHRRGIASTSALLASALVSEGATTVPSGLAVSTAAISLANPASTVGIHLLTIMSTSKTLLLGALAAIVTMGSFAVYQQAKRHASDFGLAAATDELSRTTARLTVAERQLAELKHELAERDSNRTKPSAAAAPANARLVADSTERNSNVIVVHMADIMKQNPTYAAFYAKDMKRNVELTYRRYLSGLKLPSAEYARLIDLLSEQALSGMDAQVTAEQSGLQRGSPEWKAAIDGARRDVQQQIDALLRRDANMSLGDLKDRVSVQHQIETSYGPDLAEAGMPLSSDQSFALTQAFVRVASRPQHSVAAFTQPSSDTWLSQEDNAIIDEASAILTPAQLDVLKKDRMENNQKDAILARYGVTGDKRLMIRTP